MKKYTLLAPLLILITTGCAPLAHIHALQPKPAQARTPSAKPEELEALVAFMIQLNRSSPDDLVKKYDALRAIPEQDRGDEKLLELSLLLSQPGFPLRNDANALQLLQAREQQITEKDSGLAPLIHWLRTTLQERARLVGSETECSDQLHDEKKRADTCNDKLQAIRKMEDSLIERNRH
jgi:hypothetical protein